MDEIPDVSKLLSVNIVYQYLLCESAGEEWDQISDVSKLLSVNIV